MYLLIGWELSQKKELKAGALPTPPRDKWRSKVPTLKWRFEISDEFTWVYFSNFMTLTNFFGQKRISGINHQFPPKVYLDGDIRHPIRKNNYLQRKRATQILVAIQLESEFLSHSDSREWWHEERRNTPYPHMIH